MNTAREFEKESEREKRVAGRSAWSDDPVEKGKKLS
jgi:hypothetical protein